MAKYRGLFKVSGNVGGVNMYEMDGKTFMRDQTSLDKERLMTDPRFQRNRENMAEFGGAGKVSKSVRRGLVSVAKQYGDKRMGSRLTGKFRKMIGLASGIRGQRPVEPQNYAVMLKGFPLNKDYALETALKLATDVQANPARNGATLTLDQFVPDLHLTIPAGASHFRVVLLVVSVSEHNYDPSVEGYLPVTASLNGLNKLEATPFMPVRGLPAQTLTLTADLPGLPTMTSTEALMVLVGVEFHQIVSGAYYILESGNAMNVVEVY